MKQTLQKIGSLLLVAMLLTSCAPQETGVESESGEASESAVQMDYTTNFEEPAFAAVSVEECIGVLLASELVSDEDKVTIENMNEVEQEQLTTFCNFEWYGFYGKPFLYYDGVPGGECYIFFSDINLDGKNEVIIMNFYSSRTISNCEIFEVGEEELISTGGFFGKVGVSEETPWEIGEDYTMKVYTTYENEYAILQWVGMEATYTDFETLVAFNLTTGDYKPIVARTIDHNFDPDNIEYYTFKNAVNCPKGFFEQGFVFSQDDYPEITVTQIDEMIFQNLITTNKTQYVKYETASYIPITYHNLLLFKEVNTIEVSETNIYFGWGIYKAYKESETV